METVLTVDNNLARGCFRLLESIFLDNAEKRKIALRDDEVASVALRLQCFICLTLSCCELCALEHVQSEILHLHRRCAMFSDTKHVMCTKKAFMQKHFVLE